MIVKCTVVKDLHSLLRILIDKESSELCRSVVKVLCRDPWRCRRVQAAMLQLQLPTHSAAEWRVWLAEAVTVSTQQSKDSPTQPLYNSRVVSDDFVLYMYIKGRFYLRGR